MDKEQFPIDTLTESNKKYMKDCFALEKKVC